VASIFGKWARFYPASFGLRRGIGTRHSHLSSSAANCAGDNAIRLVVLVEGHANCPCSSRLVSKHRPTPPISTRGHGANLVAGVAAQSPGDSD
jgi:hypothetical protein